MTEYDLIKAQKEICTSRADDFRIIQSYARATERRYAELEAEHNVALRLEAFAKEKLEDARAKLQQLMQEAERKANERGGAT